jgi:hypothetical protein
MDLLATLPLSDEARMTAGIILLTVVAVESGGVFLLRIARGRVAATPFQRAFFRAGHAHAGVLVTLALICQILADGTELEGAPGFVARSGIPAAAILIPAGFFLAAAGRGAERPNRLVVLVYVGALSVALGAVTLGIGLLRA